MTSITKNEYIDKLDNIIDKYNNICHRTIKMKPTDVQASRYIDYDVENYDKVSKLNVCDFVRISKYKNIFAEDYISTISNWSGEKLLIKKVKNTYDRDMLQKI